MKTTLETEDIQAIAAEVIKTIKPLLKSKTGGRGEDIVFDVQGLSEYLKVDESWVYKQAQFKAVPHFKCGRYLRFKKSQIDKWIDSETVNPVSSLFLLKNSR